MSSRQRDRSLLAGARRHSMHCAPRGCPRCTVGATHGASSSRCTAASSRPSRRALRWVGTASDAYLAKPRENQGAVLLPARAAQWLRQRPRPPGEEALYKYPTLRVGYHPASGLWWCGNPHNRGAQYRSNTCPLSRSPASLSLALPTLACDLATSPPPPSSVHAYG